MSEEQSKDATDAIVADKKINYATIVIDALVLVALSSVFCYAINMLMKSVKNDNIDGSVLVTMVRTNNEWADEKKFKGEEKKAGALGERMDKFNKALKEQLVTNPETLAQKNVHGLTALMEVCNINYSSLVAQSKQDAITLPFIKPMIDAGSDVNANDNDGWTALMWASWSGLPSVLDELVKNGAAIDVVDTNGYTPCMLAAMRGNVAIVRYLVEEHAVDLNAKNRDGKTAMDLATETYEKNIAPGVWMESEKDSRLEGMKECMEFLGKP